jgi:hypothetical protein
MTTPKSNTKINKLETRRTTMEEVMDVEIYIFSRKKKNKGLHEVRSCI